MDELSLDASNPIVVGSTSLAARSRQPITCARQSDFEQLVATVYRSPEGDETIVTIMAAFKIENQLGFPVLIQARKLDRKSQSPVAVCGEIDVPEYGTADAIAIGEVGAMHDLEVSMVPHVDGRCCRHRAKLSLNLDDDNRASTENFNISETGDFSLSSTPRPAATLVVKLELVSKGLLV